MSVVRCHTSDSCWVAVETCAAVGAQAVQWLTRLTDRARAKRAKDASEVRSWLDGVIGRVEREVVRGMRSYCGLLNGLLRQADRAEARRKRKAEGGQSQGRAAKVRAERRERAVCGEQPIRRNLWQVDRILFVRVRPGGGRQVLM